MVVIHYRSKRKPSSGRYRAHRSKRLFEIGRTPTLPRIEVKKFKVIKTRGGNKKVKMLSEDTINLTDSKSKKTSKAKMTRVVDNPANKQYTRMNVLTKGAIVETEKGNAKVTNRPGQDGCVAGVLVK